ncbi:MAG: hypothetical protein J07AB43_02390 [Candidatus Nanosalina sp. J07AB43]|nr:MAG: hypothetical protein J07AB43_02390 [Candidatus Nanosalina sp. J07AB43]
MYQEIIDQLGENSIDHMKVTIEEGEEAEIRQELEAVGVEPTSSYEHEAGITLVFSKAPK